MNVVGNLFASAVDRIRPLIYILIACLIIGLRSTSLANALDSRWRMLITQDIYCPVVIYGRSSSLVLCTVLNIFFQQKFTTYMILRCNMIAYNVSGIICDYGHGPVFAIMSAVRCWTANYFSGWSAFLVFNNENCFGTPSLCKWQLLLFLLYPSFISIVTLDRSLNDP